MGVKGRMRKLLRRPSPAMIVAVAGVAVAMSGDAVADGVKAVASVVGKDQVTSRSVKDGSLLLRDIKRSERAKLKGRRGPRGPQGASGTPALDQVFREGETFAVATAERTQCPGTPQNTCYVPVAQYATHLRSAIPVSSPSAVASGPTLPSSSRWPPPSRPEWQRLDRNGRQRRHELATRVRRVGALRPGGDEMILRATLVAVAGLATAGGNAVMAKTRSRPGRSRIAASSSPTSRDPRETR